MKIVRLLNLDYHPFNLNYASSVVTLHIPKKCVLTSTQATLGYTMRER